MKGFLLQVAFNLFPSMTYIYFLYIQLCHSRSAVFATLVIQHYIKYSCFAFGNHFVLITNTFVSQIHNIVLQCLYKKTLRCNSLILYTMRVKSLFVYCPFVLGEGCYIIHFVFKT